jgi:hypothetical protein
VEKTRYAENPNADIEKNFSSGFGDFSLTIQETGVTYGEMTDESYAYDRIRGFDFYNASNYEVNIDKIPNLNDKYVSLLYFEELDENSQQSIVARHYIFHAMSMEPKEMHLILHFSIPESEFTKEKEALIYEIAKTLQIKKWGTW